MTPTRRKIRDLQIQIDDLGRAHHATAMAVTELRLALEHQEEIDLQSALSAALDLIVSLQGQLDDTRNRLVVQESQRDGTATALEELTQRHAVLSRIVEGQLARSAEGVHSSAHP
jgi:chromosome segregation ATPase